MSGYRHEVFERDEGLIVYSYVRVLFKMGAVKNVAVWPETNRQYARVHVR